MALLIDKLLKELQIDYSVKDQNDEFIYSFDTTLTYKENEETPEGIKFLTKKQKEKITIIYRPITKKIIVEGHYRGFSGRFNLDYNIKQNLVLFLKDNTWKHKLYSDDLYGGKTLFNY